MPDMHKWWQSGAIYQIYPRSFQDSNGDGIGDLQGITERLELLVELGIDAIWISPIYPSPMADFGYDISDYCDIDPIFGDLRQFDALVAKCHRLGLRLILDFVPNHTSDQHPWFVESRRSRSSEKRDWYIWRDGAAGGGPPNNWLSEFGGSAWSWDKETKQYYYHAYLPQQPDLNWRNPAVEEAMLQVMRFWLDRGVDGFRTDAIHHLFEDELLRDNPPNPEWLPTMSPARSVIRLRTMDQPEVQDAIVAMRRVADSYPGDRVMIGEAYLPISRMMAYYGTDLAGFHLPFNFHLMSTEWNAQAIANLVDSYESALPAGGWPNWVLGNHDRSRVASRLGGEPQARVAAMLLLTLRGTPTLYQGDELGMMDAPIAASQVKDPWEKNVPGRGLGRDPVRTPMQWSAELHAGFTQGEPWLPVAPDYRERNREAQSRDSRGIYSLYRRLLAVRRKQPALSVGSYRLLSSDHNLLLFERRHGEDRCVVALNFDEFPKKLPAAFSAKGPFLSTWLDRETHDAEIRGHEGLLQMQAA